MNKKICETLYAGIVADTNRFLFSNSKSETFEVASEMLKTYNIDITKIYLNLYKRPLSEVKMFGYLASNLEVTENGVGYIKVKDDILSEMNVDAATCGNLINEFNNTEELLVWVTATEDLKNEVIRVSIRSRGPVINKLAETFGGGGHAQASGAKLKTFKEVDDLIKKLDILCSDYTKGDDDENN